MKNTGDPIVWSVYIVLSFLIVGLLIGSLFVYLGFQENSQGEFYDPTTGKYDWPYILLIFSGPVTYSTLAGVAIAAPFIVYKLFKTKG